MGDGSGYTADGKPYWSGMYQTLARASAEDVITAAFAEISNNGSTLEDSNAIALGLLAIAKTLVGIEQSLDYMAGLNPEAR